MITVGGAPAPPTSTALFQINDIGNNTTLATYTLGTVGGDWQPAIGLEGDFSGWAHTSDMLLRNGTGTFLLYDINNNNITNSVLLGTVGLEWQVKGFGNFGSRGESDMILRDSNTGAFRVYDISNDEIIASFPLGTVGLEWQVAGINTHDTQSDLVLRNIDSGAIQLYNINNNQITSSVSLGVVGLNWQIAGFGNFSSVPGEGDMMMRNTDTGEFTIYDISNNQITGTFLAGTVGPDWQVRGFGPMHGAGTSDMMLQQYGTGALEAYDIANNKIIAAANMGWLDARIGGIVPAPPAGSPGAFASVSGSSDNATSQLVQSMAGFGGSTGAIDGLNTAPIGADTSQQTFLTPPHA
jgi:hypothetical protein